MTEHELDDVVIKLIGIANDSISCDPFRVEEEYSFDAENFREKSRAYLARLIMDGKLKSLGANNKSKSSLGIYKCPYCGSCYVKHTIGKRSAHCVQCRREINFDLSFMHDLPDITNAKEERVNSSDKSTFVDLSKEFSLLNSLNSKLK